MNKLIQLPNGRNVTLGEYARSWKALRELKPSAQVANWSYGYTDAQEILRDMSRGVHERINSHIPGFGQGRKWSAEYYWPMWRASRELNNPRLRIYWLPSDLVSRFASRVSKHND